MQHDRIIQGRPLRPQDVQVIQRLIEENPSWNRTRLSRELCVRWNWRASSGQMKDMACRSFLLTLERMGELTLPPRQGPSVNHLRHQSIPLILHSTASVTGDLQALRPLRMCLVSDPGQESLFACLVHQYHYLSYQGIVGENLKYLAYDRLDRPLACLLFGSAAWKTAPRDTFIGWDTQTRQQNLRFLTNNMRFLILPWVRVPHLASHILGQVVKRIRADWTAKYGHPIHLLETFVERDRFVGTCYRAANWIYVGQTKGRSRNDHDQTLQVPLKAVYLYPLSRNVRGLLCQRKGPRQPEEVR